MSLSWLESETKCFIKSAYIMSYMTPSLQHNGSISQDCQKHKVANNCERFDWLPAKSLYCILTPTGSLCSSIILSWTWNCDLGVNTGKNTRTREIFWVAANLQQQQNTNLMVICICRLDCFEICRVITYLSYLLKLVLGRIWIGSSSYGYGCC